MTLNNNWYLTEVELDKADGYIHPLLAHEGDVGGRGIALKVTENGQSVNLTGYAVTLDWSIGKNWGSEPFTVDDASKGEFTLEYPTHMQIPGKLTARISINKGSTFVTGSRNFELHVQHAPVSDDLIEGDENYSLLISLVEQVEDTIGNITDAEALARTAATAANNAATAANTAATSANSAKQSATNAASSANAAANRASTAATNAEGKITEMAMEITACQTAGYNATAAANNAGTAAIAAGNAADLADAAATSANAAATSATTAAAAANEAAERAENAADGKTIEFCSTEAAVQAIQALF